MHYVVTLSVPAATTIAAPVVAEFSPLERIVKEIQIDWLTVPTDKTKVGIRVLDGSSKPILPGGGMAGGATWIISSQSMLTIPGDDIPLMMGSPYTIRVESYNTNATGNNADVQIRFVIVNMTLLQAALGLLQLVKDALSKGHDQRVAQQTPQERGNQK